MGHRHLWAGFSLKALQEKPNKSSFKGEGRRCGQLCSLIPSLIITPTIPQFPQAHPPATAHSASGCFTLGSLSS